MWFRAKFAAGGARRAEHTGAVPAVPSARVGRAPPIWQNANAKSRVLCPSVTECGAAAGRAISSFRRGPRSPTCSSRSLGNEALFLRLRFAQEMVPDRRRPPRVRRTTTKAPSRGRSVAFCPRMVKLAKRFRLRFQERPSELLQSATELRLVASIDQPTNLCVSGRGMYGKSAVDPPRRPFLASQRPHSTEDLAAARWCG